MEDFSQPSLDLNAAQDFAKLARVQLSLEPPTLRSGAFQAPSDFDLNPDALEIARGKVAGRPAAVLVPVIARSEPTLLFTQRPDHLADHSGQISFPGGKVDTGDLSLKATALREAHEEVGLNINDAEVLGFLDGYQTATGYLIAPVVALIPPSFQPTPNAQEVAEVFEAPLSFFMNPDNHRIESKLYRQKMRKFYAMPFENRYIWGATAGILRNLYTRLYDS